MRYSPDYPRLYRGLHRDLFFRTDPHIYRYRSTVNQSPFWGIRSGTAHIGVGPGAKRFVHRYKWKRRSRGLGRIFAILIREKRINREAFRPGMFSRWD